MQKVLKVAIIEDDADDREFIENALNESSKDVQVQSFPLATVFMEQLEEKKIRPDLIVTDLRMPHMTGFDLITKLKSHDHSREIPVVVLSTSGNQEDVYRAKALGASEYFVKPYSVEGFQEISRNIIVKFARFEFSAARLFSSFFTAIGYLRLLRAASTK